MSRKTAGAIKISLLAIINGQLTLGSQNKREDRKDHTPPLHQQPHINPIFQIQSKWVGE